VPDHPGEARLHRRDQVGRLLKKIPAASHRPLAWIMATLLAAALGLTAGLAAAPHVSRCLVRFLGMETTLPDSMVRRRTRPDAPRRDGTRSPSVQKKSG
jgi:hypothetical protein